MPLELRCVVISLDLGFRESGDLIHFILAFPQSMLEELMKLEVTLFSVYSGGTHITFLG